MRARLVGLSLRWPRGPCLPTCRCGTSCWTRCRSCRVETAIAAAGAAADRSGGAEDLPERQVRHAGADARAGFRCRRRIDDTMLISYRPGGRPARPRHGRAGATASRPHADQLRRGHRHRPQPACQLRPGADRPRHRLCRRGCRRDAAAVAGAAAAAARQSRAGAVRADGAPADPACCWTWSARASRWTPTICAACRWISRRAWR